MKNKKQIYNFSESSKSRMWRFEEPQFGHPCSIMTYKDYNQTWTTTEHSINQPYSESVKFDIKWVDKRVENRVAASCKKNPIDTTSLMHDCLLFG